MKKIILGILFMMMLFVMACGSEITDEKEELSAIEDNIYVDTMEDSAIVTDESRVDRYNRLYDTYVVNIKLDGIEGNVEYFTATVKDSIYDSYLTEDVAIGAIKECYSLLSDSNNSPNCEGYTESGKLVFSFGAGGDYEYVHVYDENYRHEQYGLISDDYDYIMGKQ